ncbi:MAG TPA: YkgJ family cysteine cluster protein [Acidimicrobiales bacterium]
MRDPDDADLDAGSFGPWLRATAAVAAGAGDADVPCGTCTACCRSSYFVHVGPEDVAARRRIPAELLFPAPGRPAGHLLMGYDERGWCPMLTDDGCSIYEDRPRTCRAFDCRVHAAAGTVPDGADDGDVAERVARWRFRTEGPDDEARWTAVRIAARHLETAELPADTAPRRAADVAVAALHTHELFLDGAAPTTNELAGALLYDRSEPR